MVTATTRKVTLNLAALLDLKEILPRTFLPESKNKRLVRKELYTEIEAKIWMNHGVACSYRQSKCLAQILKMKLLEVEGNRLINP